MEKRIIIFTNHFFPENFKINDVANNLSHDFETYVISGIPNYPKGNFFKGYGLIKKNKEQINKNLVIKRLPLIARGNANLFRLFLNYFSYLTSHLLYLIKILLQKKYDVILVHHTSPPFIIIPALIYAKIKKSKIIYWELDIWPDSLSALNIKASKLTTKIIEYLMRKAYQNFDHILIGSKYYTEICKRRDVASNKITYFPNWAESCFTDKQDLKNKIDFVFPNGFNILYTGNIGEAQDFTKLAKIIELLKNEKINWIFVGDGRKKNELERIFREKKLSEKVFFLGSYTIEKIPLFFKEADALYISLKDLPVFHKTVPAKLQTYMTSKKPIIGLVSGESFKLINKANCGITCYSNNYDQFAKKILILSQKSKKELKKYGTNGYNFYHKNFTFSARMKEIRGIIKSF